MMRIALFALTLLLSTSALKGQEKRPMTPLDVAKIRNVAGAVYSHDSKYIAYAMRIQADPLKENLPASYEMHVYNVDKRKSTAFITRGSVRAMAFRPGHSSITFLNRLDDAANTIIYEIPMSGGEARAIVEHETSIINYQWSPDGTEILFVAREIGEAATSDLPYQPEIYEGELIFRRAWVVNPEKGGAELFPIEGNIESAVWSNDGGKLLMSVSPSPLVDDHYMEQRLHIVSRQSKNVVASIDHAGKMGQFCFSPDGQEIAFIAGADKLDPVAARLFTASSSGGKPKGILPSWQGAFESIEWLQQDRIHYLGSKGAESVYGTISPVANEMEENEGKGLAISMIDFNSDGSMVMIGDRWNHPPELFINSGNSTAIRLTSSNLWLDEIAMGEQEVVRYQAADGLEVEGILIYPYNYDDAEKYPLLVAVHGGPEAHINNGWLTGYSYPGQVASAKGYAVFYPNYRGSTGRGLEYTLTSQGDPAGKEFDDIVDGVDYLIEIGVADKNKIGVTGGSYGGYATAWLSTRYSDRFAGGVMFVGISDNVAKWGTTDIPNEEYLVHARKWVYEDYDFFLKRSPIYYAGQCKTPLLIMHGKEDPRVHPSQSMEMYRHVKNRTDTPVELIFYPGEGHGNARATARYDYNLRMLQWFDTHVKGIDKS